MPWYDIIWNDEPGGNAEHIAEHGLSHRRGFRRRDLQSTRENDQPQAPAGR